VAFTLFCIDLRRANSLTLVFRYDTSWNVLSNPPSQGQEQFLVPNLIGHSDFANVDVTVLPRFQRHR